MNIDSYLTIPPDWGKEVKIKHIWRTGIQRSVTGAEKRSAYYTWKRLAFQYRISLLSYQESVWFFRYLNKYLSLIWGIPVWVDETYLTSQASSGQAVLNVDTTNYRRFEEGRRVLLLSPIDFTSLEEGEIQSMTSTQLTLVSNLGSTWPAGTLIYPLIATRLESVQEVSLLTAAYGSFVLSAEEAYE